MCRRCAARHREPARQAPSAASCPRYERYEIGTARFEQNAKMPTLRVARACPPAPDPVGRPRQARGGILPTTGELNTMHDDQLSDLIGQIYDAALDSALWSEVLGEIRRFVGGHAAALYWKDAAEKNGGVYHDDGGIDPHYRQLYFDKYVKIDPTTTGHFFSEIEVPTATADLMPYDEFSDTRFYKEWAQPQGLVDCVNAVLEKSATSVAMVGVFRHQRDGMIDDDARQRMRLVVPHIRRAVLIGRTIDIKAADAATFADTFDGIAAGMFL